MTAKRWVTLALLALVHSGCATGPTAPLYQYSKPTSPAGHFTLTLDSLPSGADVYQVTDAGTLGQKIGSTPIKVRIGVAPEWIHVRGRFDVVHSWHAWGQMPESAIVAVDHDGPQMTIDALMGMGLSAESILQQRIQSKDRLVVNFALVKDGFPTKDVRNLTIQSLSVRPLNVREYTNPSNEPGPVHADLTLNLHDVVQTIPLTGSLAPETPRDSAPGISTVRGYRAPAEGNSLGYQQAKREYEAALAAYKKALSDLDTAKNMRSLSNMSLGTMMSGSKLDRAVGLLNQGTTHLSLQQAERNVQVARDRLDRAKARLDSMNWR